MSRRALFALAIVALIPYLLTAVVIASVAAFARWVRTGSQAYVLEDVLGWLLWPVEWLGSVLLGWELDESRPS